ncbi:MAG: SPFH domain-containing protein [Trueperaceae bacterium]|nr:SPFH domain-containing protein [Trueperaceae bacterium]
MGFWNRVKSEFIDIIEWLDDSNDTMVYRFERHGNEIKYGAQLVVRPGQVAVFVNEGKTEQSLNEDTLELADVFEPGTYTLETQNLPVLSTLRGWKYGFQSPFKAEVYFFSTRRFTNQKWGTPNPIMIRDPEFGPVRLRAFGTFSHRITDAGLFLREIVGTDGHFTLDEIHDQLRSLVITRFSDALGEASGNTPVLDMAANYNEMSTFITEKVKPDFKQYGIELLELLISNINLPPAVAEALDKRSSMGILGDMNAYTQYQTAEAIEDAANNPSGVAGMGVGMGAGFGMGQQMQNAFNQQSPQNPQNQPPQQNAPQAPSAPPPLPQVQFHLAIDGQTHGPYDTNTLKQYVGSGHLTRQTLVWKQGMDGWKPAGEVPELANLFGAAPPPPPPPSL